MRMPKPVKNSKPVLAISTDAYDRAMTKRLLAAMEAFMAADNANDAVAPTQRAA
jgi:hypothetical protein